MGKIRNLPLCYTRKITKIAEQYRYNVRPDFRLRSSIIIIIIIGFCKLPSPSIYQIHNGRRNIFKYVT